MKIIALYSIKGGVGKTAACTNLAYLSALEGKKTLICDLDPQGSSTFYFRIRSSKKFTTKKLLKGGKKFASNIKATDYENLDMLPSDFSYRNFDINLDIYKKSKKQLKNILQNLNEEYDVIFIDCPPNITLLSENVFNAAHFIFVPFIPTTLSHISYEKLLKFFKDENLKKKKIYGFFSMVERRKKLQRETLKEIVEKNKNFLNNYIPYLSDIEKMGIYREPVCSHMPRSAASQNFRNLWEEIEKIVFKQRKNK